MSAGDHKPDHKPGINTSIQSVDVLLVDIGGRQVLLRLSEIKKVLRAKNLTAVPMGPEHLKGLANVHGQIVCIIDVGGITSLPHCAELTAGTRFLLLRHAEMHVGIWVDAVYKMQKVDVSLLAKLDENSDSIQSIAINGVSYDFLQCGKLLHQGWGAK